MPSSRSHDRAEKPATFDVTITTDGSVVIVADKWHASALRAACFHAGEEMSDSALLQDRYSYTSNTLDDISHEMRKIEDLGPAEDLSQELREELEQH